MTLVGVTVAATLITVTVVALGLLWSGAYDVAATAEHAGLTRWTLGTLQRNSVAARAQEPEGGLPTDSSALRTGFHHFDAMCVTCHGAPGVEPSEIGRGMTPRPPPLSRAARRWSDGELIRITAHGIRLAGMPAFGPTHSEAEIREIVSFVRLLPAMDSAGYARWRETAAEGPHHGADSPDGGGGGTDAHDEDGHSH